EQFQMPRAARLDYCFAPRDLHCPIALRSDADGNSGGFAVGPSQDRRLCAGSPYTGPAESEIRCTQVRDAVDHALLHAPDQHTVAPKTRIKTKARRVRPTALNHEELAGLAGRVAQNNGTVHSLPDNGGIARSYGEDAGLGPSENELVPDVQMHGSLIVGEE